MITDSAGLSVHARLGTPFVREGKRTKVYSEEEFFDMMQCWSSPNGRYRREHNEDGTVTQFDTELHTQELL